MVSKNTANINSLYGIFLYYCDNITVSENTANQNTYNGIFLIASNNNRISGSTVNNNERGIDLDASDYNTISGNTIYNNEIGIYLIFSYENHILNNDFYGNGKDIDEFYGVETNNGRFPFEIVIIIASIAIIMIITVMLIIKKKPSGRRLVSVEDKAKIVIQSTHERKREGILNCYYHPGRQASTKCEKCGKVICLECKTVYHETRSTGTGDSRSSYSVRREFCPVCFYDH